MSHIRSLVRGRILLFFCSVCILGLYGMPVHAQVYSGSVTGVVTDPSGAVVPGAGIKLTDLNKGFSYEQETDPTGRYLLRSLPPGTYRLTVTRTGFRAYVQEGITLDVGQSSSIDVGLQLGAETQAVEVVGRSPILATQDGVSGQVIDRSLINDLPLVGRSVFDLAFLAPGIAPTTSCGGCFANNFHSNGGRNASNDIVIDGVTTTGYETNGAIEPLYVPSVDAVQEFKVQQSNFGADIGFTGATVVNVVTRSGTNAFHGSAWDFVRNNILTANDFFNNAAGQDLSTRRYNMFGFTVGGPIRKDRTFFFFDYEGLRDISPRTVRAGLPSASMRAGDFGEICGAGFDASGMCLDEGGGGQLWDPYSGVYDPAEGGPVRSSFIPFNNLATYQSPGDPKLDGTGYQLPATPGNLIDPAAAKMMQFYPLPNLNVGTPGYNRFNNYLKPASAKNPNNQWDLKIDHEFGPRARWSARFSKRRTGGGNPNCFGVPVDPCYGPLIWPAFQFAWNQNYNLGPATLLNVTLGTVRSSFDSPGGHAGFEDFDPVQELGLPSYITRSGIVQAPYIFVGDYAAGGDQGGSIGNRVWTGRRGQDTHHLVVALDRMQGRHELKFGGEGRLRRTNEVMPGAPAGLFAFDYVGTSQRPWDSSGDAMASFLTGVTVPGGWGLYQIPAFLSTQNFQYAGFIQDNWRVTDKLTLNLGLRYDLSLPRTERHNRLSYLDPNAPSPLQVPDFPNLRGGVRFVGPGMRSNYIADGNNWGPRLGFAYRLRDNFVLRGGYGLFYTNPSSGALGIGAGDTQGFQKETNWTTSYQNDGATPWGRPSDPWPITGPDLPPGSSLGLLTDVGLGVFGPLRTRAYGTTPYEQTWSLGLQRELPGSILIDAAYVGKKGTHLYFGGAGGMNNLGPELINYTPGQIEELKTYVPNPFAGVITDPTSPLSAPEVQAYQLLRPFPQFTGFEAATQPVSNSIYHAFQLRVEKRLSRGLQFLTTYTISKSIDDSSVGNGGVSWLGGGVSLQDPNRRFLERSLSQFDIPQILQFSYVYEFPVGRGKHFGANWNPWLSGILGGWRTNGIWRFASGQPIALGLRGGQAIPTYGPQRPNLVGALERNDGPDFRDRYFSNPEVAVSPEPYALGTASRVLPNVRAPGINLASLSLFKEIPLSKLREGMRLEYRAEAFNAFNHPIFCGPDATVGSPSFGQVFGQCQASREFQMALKLYW